MLFIDVKSMNWRGLGERGLQCKCPGVEERAVLTLGCGRTRRDCGYCDYSLIKEEEGQTRSNVHFEKASEDFWQISYFENERK